MERPSDEAQGLVEAKARQVAARGFDAVRPLAGYVSKRILFVDWIKGASDGEFDEVVGESGEPYHLVTYFLYRGEDEVGIEVSIQSDGDDPARPFYAEWTLTRDGALTREY